MLITVHKISHLISNIYGNQKCLLVRYGDVIFHAKPGDVEIYFISDTCDSVIEFLHKIYFCKDLDNASERVQINTKRGKPVPLNSGDEVTLEKELNVFEMTAVINSTYVLNRSQPEYFNCFCNYVDNYLKTENIESKILIPLLIQDIIETVNHVKPDGTQIFPVVKILLVSRNHSLTEKEWNYYDTIYKPISGTFYQPLTKSPVCLNYLYTVSVYSNEISELNSILSEVKSDRNLIILTRK